MDDHRCGRQSEQSNLQAQPAIGVGGFAVSRTRNCRYRIKRLNQDVLICIVFRTGYEKQAALALLLLVVVALTRPMQSVLESDAAMVAVQFRANQSDSSSVMKTEADDKFR